MSMASQPEAEESREQQNEISSGPEQDTQENCVMCGRSDTKCSCSMTLDVMENGNFNGGGKSYL